MSCPLRRRRGRQAPGRSGPEPYRATKRCGPSGAAIGIPLARAKFATRSVIRPWARNQGAMTNLVALRWRRTSAASASVGRGPVAEAADVRRAPGQRLDPLSGECRGQTHQRGDCGRRGLRSRRVDNAYGRSIPAIKVPWHRCPRRVYCDGARPRPDSGFRSGRTATVLGRADAKVPDTPTNWGA
jgi:hypothetical protein